MSVDNWGTRYTRSIAGFDRRPLGDCRLAKPKVGSRSFNARADSVATKPLFRNAFQRRRLLVPVSGFYGWKAVPDRKAKQPHWFTRSDEEPVVCFVLGRLAYCGIGPWAKVLGMSAIRGRS